MKHLSLNQLIDSGFQLPTGEPEQEYFQRFEPSFTIIQLRAAIESIQEPDRTIFLLHADKLKQKEIAEIVCREQYFVSRSIKRTRVKLLKILGSA